LSSPRFGLGIGFGSGAPITQRTGGEDARGQKGPDQDQPLDQPERPLGPGGRVETGDLRTYALAPRALFREVDRRLGHVAGEDVTVVVLQGLKSRGMILIALST
jgi:hypothetical protein